MLSYLIIDEEKDKYPVSRIREILLMQSGSYQVDKFFTGIEMF